jgi:hypothetical protein
MIIQPGAIEQAILKAKTNFSRPIRKMDPLNVHGAIIFTPKTGCIDKVSFSPKK